MSIYRGWKAHQDYRPESLETGRAARPSAPAKPRKAEPLNNLLPRTATWIAALPQESRPHELARQFARIANELCATWDDPAECRAYLDTLLIDNRGSRQGFPPAIVGELLRLRETHAERYPTTEMDWQIPRKSSR